MTLQFVERSSVKKFLKVQKIICTQEERTMYPTYELDIRLITRIYNVLQGTKLATCDECLYTTGKEYLYTFRVTMSNY